MAGAGAWIVGVGMMTPVGDSAAQSLSSIRAGISRLQESSVYNRQLQPMKMALLPDDALPPLAEALAAERLTARQRRMLRLAGPALMEALGGASISIPLLIAGPEPAPRKEPAIGHSFLRQLGDQIDQPLDLGRSKVLATGRAGAIEALAEAIEILDSGQAARVLVGGVDSHLDLMLLAELDAEGRVLAEGVMDGFAPGEAAAFLLLSAEPGASPVAHLQPPGLGQEAGHGYSDEPYRGEGLAEALAAALEPLEGEPVRTVFSSLNGESFGAKEWGVAAMRSSAGLDPEYRFEHPADCIGDTGGAAGAVLIGLAALGLRAGQVDGPALVYGSSDAAPRAAVCLTVDN